MSDFSWPWAQEEDTNSDVPVPNTTEGFSLQALAVEGARSDAEVALTTPPSPNIPPWGSDDTDSDELWADDIPVTTAPPIPAVDFNDPHLIWEFEKIAGTTDDPAIAHKIFNSVPNQYALTALANNQQCPLDILIQLSTHPSPMVRWAALRNPSLNIQSIREQDRNTWDSCVLIILLSRPDCPPDLLRTIVETHEWDRDLILYAVTNPNCTNDLRGQIMQRIRELPLPYLEDLATNIITPPPVLNILVHMNELKDMVKANPAFTPMLAALESMEALAE